MVFQILLSDKQMKPLFDKERIPPKRRLCLGKWADIDPVIGIAEVIGDVDPGLGNVIVFLYVFEQVKDFLAEEEDSPDAADLMQPVDPSGPLAELEKLAASGRAV